MIRAASTSPQRTRSSIVNFLKSAIQTGVRLSQKLEQRFIERLGSLEIRNMPGVLKHRQTRTRDRLMHLLTVRDGRDRVVSSDENQRRNRDLRQQLRLIVALRHSTQRGRGALRLRLQH